MFDWNTPVIQNNLANAESRVGDLFSIVTWNPVNICRAPSDAQRGGIPGENIDRQVVGWLNANQGSVNAQWLAALNVLDQLQVRTVADIRTYLAACTATLPGQQGAQGAPTGYYRFNWTPAFLPA